MQNVNNTKTLFRFVAVIVILFAISTLSTADVSAIEYGGFGGKPAYPVTNNPRTQSIFVHTLEAGVTQKEGVMVVNNSAEPKTILIYGVDSTPSTGGAFACAQASENSSDVGAWITLEKTEVTLDPGTNEIIPFVIDVPQNAGVGEHNGCIVMQQKKAVQTGSGANLSFRTGLRVVVTIPGELTRKLEIAGLTVTSQKGGYLLHPLVTNIGNVSIDAKALVETRYFFGLTYATNGGQYPILRGDTSDWNFELKKPFWGGLYRSNVIVKYDEHAEATVGIQSGKTLTKLKGPSVWFFSFPTIGGLIIEFVILLLALFGGFLLVVSQKRKQWIIEHWVGYEVQPGDSINSLATKFDVSWKLLAKVNKLKPPYACAPGEKIKVPPKT
ncbi:MAG: hypothetical protein COX82_04855 [Candidatus Magasanikbacteria bacterium CG_4_10_14_0_2_um_filter_41_10]|uniref:LysM domain-containing protein n=1 Tax=Candidatus Magasanikbacteria bacterium CG_4_10_14_0_2_um_filter_41_10 TaxID=1974638 RepID=A0A2M7V210_9BACT|nr:MAG: hypothetical protein COX82_04855 [Candidatus Magasanikbacteria bacterium CG_4_10_14_0_2_um_filter_41_10]